VIAQILHGFPDAVSEGFGDQLRIIEYTGYRRGGCPAQFGYLTDGIPTHKYLLMMKSISNLKIRNPGNVKLVTLYRLPITVRHPDSARFINLIPKMGHDMIKSD
jgi:hypothetical protein